MCVRKHSAIRGNNGETQKRHTATMSFVSLYTYYEEKEWERGGREVEGLNPIMDAHSSEDI